MGSCAAPFKSPPRDIYVSDPYAYLACYDGGLVIIDVSDPTNPSPAGSYDTPGQAWNVYVRGSYAYVADGQSGLLIIEILE